MLFRLSAVEAPIVTHSNPSPCKRGSFQLVKAPTGIQTFAKERLLLLFYVLYFKYTSEKAILLA